MNKSIDIELIHLKIVKDILKKYFISSVNVWVFGSRTTGKAKKYSDLDLAIDFNSQRLSMSLLADLSHDFEESSLPYKVDILDWNAIDESFKKNIASDRVLII
jgi:type I restriction enzyme S subunit